MWEVLGVGCRERFRGDIIKGDPCSSPCPDPGADSGPGSGSAVVVTMAKLSLC